MLSVKISERATIWFDVFPFSHLIREGWRVFSMKFFLISFQGESSLRFSLLSKENRCYLAFFRPFSPDFSLCNLWECDDPSEYLQTETAMPRPTASAVEVYSLRKIRSIRA
eukprot:m.372219 g.372219  ORF g.372219 m.372219 type:complete len:111 (-) comp56143_c0_seq23:5087-5419(-)